MAIKLADTLAPMADFPAAMAEHIEFSDGENLQEKLDNGSLGGGAVKNYLRLKGTVGYEPQMVEITPSLVQSVLTNATPETIEGRWILEEAETNTEIFDTDGNFSLPALEKVTFTKLDDYKVLGITDITSTAISCRAIVDIDTPFEIILEWKEENDTGHIELTQAEYDALPEEEKMNGAIYFITDADADIEGSSKTNYLHENKLGYIAHRGSSISAPTNSTKAFELAGDFGYEAIELDVQYTSDGVPVIMHDSTVDATTDGTGEVANMTLDEIKLLQLDTDFLGKDDEIIRVPTFEESVKACKKKNLIMNIDCSKMVWTEEIMHDIVGRLKKYNMLDYCFFVMTNEEQRELFLSLYPDICITWLSSDPTSEANIEYCNKYKNAFVTYSVNNITETLLEEYNNAGIPVFLYQCQTPELCEKYADYGVRFIETDYILPPNKNL